MDPNRSHEDEPSQEQDGEPPSPERTSGGFMFSPRQSSAPETPAAPDGAPELPHDPPPPPPPGSPNYRQMSVSDLLPPGAERPSRPSQTTPPAQVDTPGYHTGPPRAFSELPEASTREISHFDFDPSDLPPPAENLPPLAILASAGVALAGALVWALLMIVTGWEFGLVAAALGAGVGYTANSLRGRGFLMGVICALLAVTGMAGGRYLGIYVCLDDWLEEAAIGETLTQAFMPPEVYHDVMDDANAFVEVESNGDLRLFMWERGYSWAENEWEIPSSELEEFREIQEPYLERVYREQPDYEEWVEMTLEEVGYSEDMITVPDYFLASIGVMDCIFLLFGVTAAFFLGRARDGDL